MEIKELTPEVAETFGIRFIKLDSWKNAGSDWSRILVKSGAKRIGTLAFKDSEFYYFNPYKSVMSREIDDIDEKFLRLERYIFDNTVISLSFYYRLERLAKLIHDEDIRIKEEWRKNHPRFTKRRGILGKNPRYILRILVLNISPNFEEFETSYKKLIDEHFKMRDLI